MLFKEYIPRAREAKNIAKSLKRMFKSPQLAPIIARSVRLASADENKGFMPLNIHTASKN